jgi:purine-nucleoside phosphorylase
VSDHIKTKEVMSVEDRQTSFNDMVVYLKSSSSTLSRPCFQ